MSESSTGDNDLEKGIVAFLCQESISPQRTKEEKIAALLALGSYLSHAKSVAFLKQESVSLKRSLEEKVAALRALGSHS